MKPIFEPGDFDLDHYEPPLGQLAAAQANAKLFSLGIDAWTRAKVRSLECEVEWQKRFGHKRLAEREGIIRRLGRQRDLAERRLAKLERLPQNQASKIIEELKA